MPNKSTDKPPVLSPAREKLHKIIFGADTFWGLVFDIVLLVAILASIVVACLQTVENIGWQGNDHAHGPWYWPLYIASWGFTFLFTIEYALRLYCVRRPIRYVRSFWGIIDLLSFLPDYILLLLQASEFGRAFSAIRSLRLLRVFRIFQLGWFQEEADELGSAIWRSRGKIVVFLATVMVIVTVAGTLMYEVEYAALKEESQFQSIPDSIYWAIVTMTTVALVTSCPSRLAESFFLRS